MKHFIFNTLIYVLLIGSLNAQNNRVGKWIWLNKTDYKILYPKNWEVDETKTAGTDFILMGDLAGNGDKFRENVNLIVQSEGVQEISLDEYVTLSQVQIVSIFRNGRIVSSEKKSENGITYYDMVSMGEQEGMLLQFEQFYFKHNNAFYCLTFTCEANEFNTLQAIGKKILNSFSFKN